jgi:HK97 family phage prohead protease
MSTYNHKQPHFLTASIKDMDVKQGIVTGYAASFNTLDADRDIIMPGAFSKTIKEQGPGSVQPRIKHLLNHNTSQPLGVPQMLKEDGNGLYYESKIGSNAVAVDFMKMVDSGLITEHSIGFNTVRKTVQNPDADWKEQKTQIHEVKLYEFSSLTAWGSNQYTPLIGMKTLKTVEDRIENLIKAIDKGTFTDTTFLFLTDELLFLQKAFKDITTPAAVAPEPDYAKQIKEAFSQFTSQLQIN